MLMEEISEADTANHIDVIETVISSLDQDNSALVSHTEDGHLWKFKYGSVEVYVQLTGTEETDTLTVWSPVLSLPAREETRLMRHLLEMNCGETFEACFGILGEQVVVLSSRILQGITPAEISRLMTIVATIADDNDEALAEEYGAV
ncbi:YbjN domain-containing protein [Pseudanabaena sp. FACHB-2040]|nr:YbjN domain-containing protein [Pseudanabaena sp. FACHB-2040]